MVIVRDRENIIGYAEVKSIESEQTSKKLAKCPNCGKADLRKRKNTEPKYLCVGCRAEFEQPVIIEQQVIKFTAKFADQLKQISLPKDTIKDDIINYNPQVSVQKANPSV